MLFSFTCPLYVRFERELNNCELNAFIGWFVWHLWRDEFFIVLHRRKQYIFTEIKMDPSKERNERRIIVKICISMAREINHLLTVYYTENSNGWCRNLWKVVWQFLCMILVHELTEPLYSDSVWPQVYVNRLAALCRFVYQCVTVVNLLSNCLKYWN